MKIASWNVNGIRAVEKKGALTEFLEREDPEVFFLQEIKGTPDKFGEALKSHPEYYQFYNSAEKPGYAGTGVWVKKTDGFAVTEPKFSLGMPEDPFADEGRICRLDFERDGESFVLLGVYFPNGGKSQEAFDGKLVFYDKFLEYVNSLRDRGKQVIWTGDVNCAHEEIDIARPKENANSIGFLPVERAWVSRCVEQGWTDVFRVQNPETVIYSWWHLISKARARNVGWRIDYFFCDQDFLPQVKNIEYLNDQMGSDHCPVILEF